MGAPVQTVVQMTEEKTKLVADKSPKAKICEGPNCPLCTRQGLATYLLGLIVGLYAPWPYNLLGVPIMLLSFVAAGWRPKLN